ncbi:MAG: serine/threonine protein kinase [Anaerolineae bacterium]|nr:serine/threonine protein kinase [Anaerolineae bacterium]
MSDNLIGETIDKYHILKVVGQGGMATVYLAHQLSMQRDVALKVLPAQFLHQPTSLERFQQEASIVARLEHRAIVPVHDYGEYNGIPYLVMRYMDGGSVDELLADGPVPVDKTLKILEQIAPALDYAHRADVLHRDLKPSNILLDANGDAYLTDFGIARILGSKTPSKQLTTTGVVGTPSYMSPEQAQGHDLDGRSDVYALGVVLFEMLTGSRPFEGETPYSVAVKHVTETPPSACEKNPVLSRAIEHVLYKVLAKNRTMRYQTAVELVEGLRAAVENPTGESLLSRAGMTETEPSLNKALQEEAARRREEGQALEDSSRTVLPQPIPPAERNLRPPSSSGSPAFAPPVAPAYTGPFVPALTPRKRKRRTAPAWMTWATIAMLIGGLVLSGVMGGVYVLLNSESATPGTADYGATAIFKLTATKQMILNGPETVETLPILTPTATVPPTNTLRPTEESPG